MNPIENQNGSIPQNRIFQYSMFTIAGISVIIGMVLIVNSEIFLGVLSFLIGQLVLIISLRKNGGFSTGNERDHLTSIDMMRSRA